MTHETQDMGKVWRIYLRISRFPILATTIRERMRHELFKRGIVDPKRFEEEVKEEAIESQQREGLMNPYTDEPSDIWERRLNILRDQRTDYYFAYNFPLNRFDDIAREVLKQRKSVRKSSHSTQNWRLGNGFSSKPKNKRRCLLKSGRMSSTIYRKSKSS